MIIYSYHKTIKQLYIMPYGLYTPIYRFGELY
nr:MAG TPA: hypothetical protein [Caudoviricetes sp.]